MTDTLELSHWIGGEKVAGDRPGESHNPSDTRDIVARTPKGGAAEVDQAVAAATDAFEAWSEASPEVRFDVLDKAGSLIMERREQIGRLLSREEGKTLAEGKGEVERQAVASCGSGVVVDLGGVTFMDSSGVGFLIGLRRLCQERGKTMTVVNPSPPIKKLLDMLRLSDYFAAAGKPADPASA